MRSLEGEIVPLANKVKTSHQVENWLDQLANEMKNTLQKLLVQCIQAANKELGNYNIEKFPSQVN